MNKREAKEYQVVFDKRIVLGQGEDSIPYGYHWNPSTTSTINPPFIPSVPDNLLYTLIHPSDAGGEQSTREVVRHPDPLTIVEDSDGIMEIDDDCESIHRTNDIDLMETDDESDNDFESERDSDIEFMNGNELSDEEELSFYRRLGNTF